MPDIWLAKAPDGSIRPADDDADKFVRRLAIGEAFKVRASRCRNYKFLRKMFALFRVAYSHFEEYGPRNIEYRGQKVEPSFERFRKDLIILAGYYDATYNVRGEVRLEAKSIAFENCEEKEAEEIYSACIDAAVKNIYHFEITTDDLRDHVAMEVLHFA